MMRSFAACIVLISFFFGAGPSILKGQDAGSEAGLTWKQARDAFAAGDYPTAAAKFSTVIQNSAPAAVKWSDNTTASPPPPLAKWLEPAFYMLGASYFNSKQWDHAITNFNRYCKLFPQSKHLAEIHFSLAQAELLGGHPKEAIPLFTALLSNPLYHEKCTVLLAESYREAGDVPAAMAVFEKERSLPNLNADFRGKISIKLLALYLEANSIDKGVALLQEIDADLTHVPDATDFNAMAIRLGDGFLAKNDIAAALNCYRRVRNNDQVMAIEGLQIERLKQQVAGNLSIIQANPLNSSDLQLTNKDIQAQIEKDEKILAQYQTLPPILPPLLLRIGRAYAVEKSYWEAAVVYRELMRQYPNTPEAEPALYGSIVVFEQARQTDRAQALCQTYLTQYPKGKYADSVGYLRGALAYDAEQLDQAIGYFNDALKNLPNHPRREQIEVILGDILLREQKFDDAIAAYAKYEKDFPNGSRLEAARYHSALALLFGGKAGEADQAIHAYLTKYPLGTYVPDAEYRLDVIKFAAKQYQEVIADGLAWQKKHGKVGPLAEVLSLMGDCYASLDDMDDAIAAYTRSYKVAQTNEVLSYSLFAAAKLLQKQGKWTDIVKMFQDFIKDNPDNLNVVGAVVWIGRADIKLGKVDEARQYMAATAKQYLDDPTREAVDEILTQLAQLYARKHLPLADATTTSKPVVDASDPAQDLVDVLAVPDLDKKETASARILYAKSELARVQRKPQVEAQILLEIAGKYKPEILSPALLGQVGDCLLYAGKADQAALCYHELLDTYDKSPLVDYAYNGLGRIAYDQKDYKKALAYYSKALDKGLAATKLKEITLGQAQTLLALDRYDDAKPVFEQVASNRAWRGEATALSVFSLGEIQMAKDKYPEANAFFQRVFVAYQKFPAIQAKAYLKSGEAFEKLGKSPEAVNTYNEMLRNPNLASFPEIEEAKQRLQNLIQK
jgi:TolA-binding protein